MRSRRPTILVLEALSGSSKCIYNAGGLPVSMSPKDLETSIDELDERDFDGILLTGGGDVDPRWYGQRAHKKTYGVDPDRDIVDGYACEIAADMRVPILGICRGAQVMGVEAGGALKQHIEGHRMTSHPVRTARRSILERAAGERPKVVSLHHQYIKEIPDDWVVSGHAMDGVPEAIESRDGRCLGVQFHPEMDAHEEYARGIFRWLVVEAALRGGFNPVAARYPKRKPAYVDRKRSYRLPTSVTQSWICPKCAMRFDQFADREDHVTLVHGLMRVGAV